MTIEPEHLSQRSLTQGDVALASEEVRTMFEEAIADLHLDEWKVVVDESGARKNFSVSQETKTAYIPSAEHLKNRSTTHTAIQTLIAHEIGTHAQRRERGERSVLRILGLGLDRYLKGEEGVATYEQQKITGADDFAGFKNHFACALASGADGVKRDFRALFEIAKQYHLATLKGVHGEKREEKANNLSWDLCVRTFRGTTCKTPGAIYSKDIVYREGNIGIYELLNNKKDEEHRFTVGKYDPTNERHVWVLDQLGITEGDLDSLERED